MLSCAVTLVPVAIPSRTVAFNRMAGRDSRPPGQCRHNQALNMNVNSILSEVDRLHEKAASIHMATMKIDGIPYELTFNGRNWVVTSQGLRVAEFNTRSVSQARKWLREYLAN